METTMIIIVAAIGLALLFDFLNGFHDAANSIATIVVTKTLTPVQAVIMAGCANFIGYFWFGTEIAKTVGKGVVNLENVTLTLILGALLGAVIWNILTWLWGLPTSSSHALIGGLVGSALAAVGPEAIIGEGLGKILMFIVVAPALGMIGSILFTILILRLFKNSNPNRTRPWFKQLQLVSSAFYSIGHGTNDAQKTMGVIALILYAGGQAKDLHLDGWVVLSCYSALALGTMFGGWRIVKTMGTKITKIHAMEGFCAESAAAVVLMATAKWGIPVSTTHVIAGSIMGVGTVENASKVRWSTARTIIWAWILTIPISASISALSYLCLAAIIGK